jgi:MFS family permease
MKLDDVLDSWRSQDEAPLYDVNSERLQQALRQDLAAGQRGIRMEAWAIYGISALMFAGLAVILVMMVFDDDPRTGWDFVIVILGAAAALLWAGCLYLNRGMRARREPRFDASLRNDIERQLALLDYQLSRVWRLSSVLLIAVPLFFGTLALWLAIGRINNLPTDVSQAIWSFLPMAAILVCGFWIARGMAERETLPRKRRLEALLKDLDAPR